MVQETSKTDPVSIADLPAPTLLVADGDGRVLDASRTAAHLLTYPREALCAGTLLDLAYDEEAREALRGLLAGTAEDDAELLRAALGTFEGTRVDVELRWTRSTAQGRPVRLVSAHDVTALLSQLREVTKSDKRLRAMLDKASESFSVTSREGVTLFTSGSVTALLGYTKEELEGKTQFDLVHPDDVPRMKAGFEEVLTHPGKTTRFEHRLRHADGSWRWIEATGVDLTDDPNIGGIVGSFRDVTARKAMELERDRFFTVALDLLCIATMDGRFRRLNPAWERTLGWRADEIVGHSWIEFVHPDDRQGTVDQAKKLLDGCVSLHFENRYRCKDGTYRWLQWAAAAMLEEGVIYATAHDVTDRRKSLEELRQSNERYQLLFDESPLATLVWDAETLRIMAANNAAVRQYGYSIPELLERTIADLQPRDEAMRLLAWLSSPSVVRAPTHWRHQRRDGLLFDAEITTHAITINGVAARVAIVRDITERRALERLRRESAERDRLLFASSPVAMGLMDVETLRFVDVNEAAATTYGYTRDELLGLSLTDITLPREGAALGDDVRRAIAFGSVRVLESQHRTKSGRTIDVEMTCLQLRVGERPAILSVVQDVTVKKHLQAQLVQAQKMEAIGSLAGGIAHDFNNILSVIMSYSAIVLDQLEPGAAIASDMREIASAAERAASLTHQLLAFSRKQVLLPRAFDLSDTVGTMENMLRRLVGEHIDLSIVSSTDDGTVYADRSQIEQVILNLVVNARDAMPSGGQLVIETSSIELDAQVMPQDLGVAPGAYVMLSVSDTGTGMDESTRARIFEPFFTTKPVGRGTGLGLPTALGIVQQSRGGIVVESEVGRGTTFHVYLPRATTATSTPLVSQAPPKDLRGSETILLVEDEQQVRELAKLILQRQGYTVLSAQNGGEAFLLCEQHASKIDLLLTDVVMPFMSGRQLAERLRVLRPDLRVLYMSGYTDDALLHHGGPATEISFVPKPVTPDALTRMIRAVLDAPPRAV